MIGDLYGEIAWPMPGAKKEPRPFVGGQTTRYSQGVEQAAREITGMQTAVLTDKGPRESNQDQAGVFFSAKNAGKGVVGVICDGVGGRNSGDLASQLAINTIINSYMNDEGKDAGGCLNRAVDRANSKIFVRAGSKHGLIGMGTTAVAAVVHSREAVVANVGDSRAYVLKGRMLKQITHDHVPAGNDPADQNKITRMLGGDRQVGVDLFRTRFNDEDVLLLCSDGLHKVVSDKEIAAAIRRHHQDLRFAAKVLVNLAKGNGSRDNISVVLMGR